MTDRYDSYRVFLASPGDVSIERDYAAQTISKIDRICKETLRVGLELKRWEDLPPVTPLTEERLQEKINDEVKRSHFFILILNKRYGSCEPGYDKSNTEREIETILQHHNAERKKKIIAYFRRNDSQNPDPGPQEQKVKELQSRLSDRGVIHRDYSSELEFREMLTHDMYNVVMRMQLSPYKKECLQKFWVFGDPGVRSTTKIAIIYPPVPRRYMGPSNGNPLWLTRLQPNIFFEDYKALHKIKRSLDLVGARRYRVFANCNPPDDLDFLNRVWVYVPRNLRAQRQLQKYQDRVRFDFSQKTKASNTMRWLTSSGKWITITSPVSKYLSEQRESSRSDGEWVPSFGRIVVKDYGVLARFDDKESSNHVEDETLKDFFIAGIRGLGTWGAAYLLDRRTKLLQNIPESGDFQMLVEVTYSNDRILDVTDISEKTAEYFTEQVLIKTIRKSIQEHKL